MRIWDIAGQAEGKARLRMLAYAAALRDPALSAATGLNGWEEGRHKEVLSNVVQTYGIALGPEPPTIEPRDPEWAIWSPASVSFRRDGLRPAVALSRRYQRHAEAAANRASGKIERARQAEDDRLPDLEDGRARLDVYAHGNRQQARMGRQRP